jgi:hypothetical protein
MAVPWADRLEHVIADGDPKPAKALLRLLVKDLHVNGRREILPTYRAINDTVCAVPKFSGRTWDRTRDLSRVKRALSR